MLISSILIIGTITFGKNVRSRDTVFWKNTYLFNQTIGSLRNSDALLTSENKTFWLMGGIYARDISDITIQIDDILTFSDNYFEWLRDPHTRLVVDCLHFEHHE